MNLVEIDPKLSLDPATVCAVKDTSYLTVIDGTTVSKVTNVEIVTTHGTYETETRYRDVLNLLNSVGV